MSEKPPPVTHYLVRPEPTSLADVIDTILDKGLIFDFAVQVSPVGLKMAFGEGRAVMGAMDSYLHFAEAAARIALDPQAQASVGRRSPATR